MGDSRAGEGEWIVEEDVWDGIIEYGDDRMREMGDHSEGWRERWERRTLL